MVRYILVLALVGAALAGGPAGGQGWLDVQSDKAGLRVFLGDDSIGYTPIRDYPVEPGDYWVSILDPDSTQDQYDVLQSGGLGRKLSTLWYLAKVQKGTTRVSIAAGQKQEVFLSWRKAQQAPAQAKWLAAGYAAIPVVLGAALGALIAVLAR